jgi:hypothetical protein
VPNLGNGGEDGETTMKIGRKGLRERIGWVVIVSGLSLFARGAQPAAAQDVPVPKFDMGKAPAKQTAWTAQAKGSLLVTSGNSQTRNGVLGVSAAHTEGAMKLALDGQVAYGRSSAPVPLYDPANPMLLIGIGRQETTTTDQWLLRARADHFFTENNAGYLLGQIGSDKVAGKQLWGGGQAGYSRQLYKDERHTAVAELGYDFSYESYGDLRGSAVDPVQIHSARTFLGEQLTLSTDTGLNASVEALFNLNRENALNANDRTQTDVAAFKDTRVIGKLGLTTKLYGRLSFAFGFTLKYDQNPAPQPLPAAAKGAMLSPTFVTPFAEKVDTLTEATLIFTIL